MNDLVGPPWLILLGLVVMAFFTVVAVRTGYISTKKNDRKRAAARDSANAEAFARAEGRAVREAQILDRPQPSVKLALPKVPGHIKQLRGKLGEAFPSLRVEKQYLTIEEWGLRVQAADLVWLVYAKDSNGWYDIDGGMWDDEADKSVEFSTDELVLRIGVDVMITMTRDHMDREGRFPPPWSALANEILSRLQDAVDMHGPASQASAYAAMIASAMRERMR